MTLEKIDEWADYGKPCILDAFTSKKPNCKVIITSRSDVKSDLLRFYEEMLENEQEETRLRAQRLGTAVDRGEVANPADISFEEVTDEHRFSGLIDE